MTDVRELRELAEKRYDGFVDALRRIAPVGDARVLLEDGGTDPRFNQTGAGKFEDERRRVVRLTREAQDSSCRGQHERAARQSDCAVAT